MVHLVAMYSDEGVAMLDREERVVSAGEGVAGSQSRESFTFVLDPDLVERARRELGERDMVRSIEAALMAAIDYQLWVREVSRGTADSRSW